MGSVFLDLLVLYQIKTWPFFQDGFVPIFLNAENKKAIF